MNTSTRRFDPDRRAIRLIDLLVPHSMVARPLILPDVVLPVTLTSAEEIVKRYKELAEIERGWRALKSTMQLRPMYHWTQERIRAHVLVCVLRLQIERWMRNKLKGASVSTAIRHLRQIKMVDMVSGEKTGKVPTRPTTEQKEILHKSDVPVPRGLSRL